MYSLFKYHDILELEQEYENEFDNINPSKKISVLPPVLKKYFGKTILAYLVISQPENQDHHYGVTRPIGAILRNIKTKRVIKVINCAYSEFAPDRNDFVREYYDLEDHEDWWPHRSANNEEAYRIILEKMFKVCKTLNIFGGYKQAYYEDYLNTVKKLFSEEYWYFFEALQQNPIVPLDEEIIYQRELAKKEHLIRAEKRKEKQQFETAHARLVFIDEIKENMRTFILKEIAPTLRNKPAYAKIDFYVYIGNMVKDLVSNEEKYLNCYNTALTTKALEANRDSTKETFKVNMIKTYAKACVKTMTEDDAVNAICEKFLLFLNTMVQQEQTGEVTDTTKEIVENCIEYFKLNIKKVQNAYAQILQPIFDGLMKDYYEVTDPNMLSSAYIGYVLSVESYQEDATSIDELND